LIPRKFVKKQIHTIHRKYINSYLEKLKLHSLTIHKK
jgi:hypothetical protein